MALAFQASANTGATGWVPMDDAGCEVIMGFGRDETTNMTDRCPAVGTQEGNNSSDFTLQFDAIATFDSNPPPGRAAATEVFDFDGVSDYIQLGVADLYEDEVGEPVAFLGWIAPDSDVDIHDVYMNYSGIAQQGSNGIKVMATRFTGTLRSIFVVDFNVDGHPALADIPIGNAWSMIGGSFDPSDDSLNPYSSRCATNTILCVTGVTDSFGTGGQSLPYSIAGDSSQTREFPGQMAEIFLWETPITPEMACQICRSGYGNDPGNPDEPDDVIVDRWSFCATRPTALGCTLPDIPDSSTPATHVGPRRIF